MTARAAKAEATKARIRAATIALYQEMAVEDFTLDDIAARAETTVQTVLRIFGSKEDLFYDALHEMAAGGFFLRSTPPGDVKAAVAAIFELYESVGDLVIRHLADEARHPAALKLFLEQGRDNHRDGVKTAFAPQLERVTGAARAELLEILSVTTDVYVWKVLRRDRGLSRAAAEAIVCRMINGVLTMEQAHGTHSVA